MRDVGTRWSDVLSRCQSGKWQPQLLLFVRYGENERQPTKVPSNGRDGSWCGGLTSTSLVSPSTRARSWPSAPDSARHTNGGMGPTAMAAWHHEHEAPPHAYAGGHCHPNISHGGPAAGSAWRVPGVVGAAGPTQGHNAPHWGAPPKTNGGPAWAGSSRVADAGGSRLGSAAPGRGALNRGCHDHGAASTPAASATSSILDHVCACVDAAKAHEARCEFALARDNYLSASTALSGMVARPSLAAPHERVDQSRIDESRRKALTTAQHYADLADHMGRLALARPYIGK